MLPVKIEPCPIVEAVVEVRFSSPIPSEAIFGVVYSQVSSVFPEVESLPILQLPEAVRTQDPNLIYQPVYVLKKDNLHLKIGPRVLTFSNMEEYIGWKALQTVIEDTMKRLQGTEVIKFPERIGIRYINLFRFAVLKRLRVDISINEIDLSNQTTSLRTEVSEGDLRKIIQVSNNIGVNIPKYSGQGSLVDIDCIYHFPEQVTEFYTRYADILERAHFEEKKTFFSLLQEDFLNEFNPIYRE